MNSLNVTGRIVKDAELSYIPKSGIPVMKFTVAVDRKYQADKDNKKVDFIPCETIGKHAESLAEYCEKGVLVTVIGELNIESFEGDDGWVNYTKCRVEHIRLHTFAKNDEDEKPKKSNKKGSKKGKK